MAPNTTLLALALAACGAAVVAVTRQSSIRGAIAGMVVATTAILGLGAGTLLPLTVFVLGGGVLTKLGHERKHAQAAAEPNEGKRGARHVAAKLAIPAILAVVAWSCGHARELGVAFAAALAGAFADTAGTEVGPLTGGPAFGIRGTGLAALPHGTAGAMSVGGLAATAVASAAVALAAMVSGLVEGPGVGALVAAAGLIAAVLESFIAPSALGRRLGHFGRNVFVSAVATGFGLGVGLSRMGMP